MNQDLIYSVKVSFTAVLRIDRMGQGQNQGHQPKDVSVIMQVTDNSGLEGW